MPLLFREEYMKRKPSSPALTVCITNFQLVKPSLIVLEHLPKPVVQFIMHIFVPAHTMMTYEGAEI
jgi:hypothetical protein